jgi:hypothetical protein
VDSRPARTLTTVGGVGAAAAAPTAVRAAAPEVAAATRASAVPAAGSTHAQPRQARQPRYTVLEASREKVRFISLNHSPIYFSFLEIAHITAPVPITKSLVLYNQNRGSRRIRYRLNFITRQAQS